MAAKTKVSRLESELEKSRATLKWDKAIDLGKQLTAKSPGIGAAASLLLGEKKLEEYLAENPATEENVTKAKNSLANAEMHLTEAVKGNIKADLKLEAQLLLAKLYYAMGEYRKTLDYYDRVNLDNITLDSVSNRALWIIAEAYAVKGMCYEKLPLVNPTPKEQKDREDLILSYFEKSGDMSILHLQERDRIASDVQLGASGSGFILGDTTAGPIVESAIQRSSIYHIKNGLLSKGIGRFRELLRAVECRSTQSLRMTLARQLAEVLLRGVCEKSYVPPEDDGATVPQRRSATQPKRYSSPRIFAPHEKNSETLLLLLIAESIAVKEAVLDRSPQHSEAREHSFNNVTAVYDLLTIALVKRSQYTMLTQSFERAMKFSFDEFHIWYQLALSLICSEKYNRALLVLEECSRLDPKNAIVLLHAARICLENLHMLDEGIEYAKRVVDLGDQRPYSSRGYLALGVGYGLKAYEVKLQSTRRELQRKAVSAFQRAHQLDSNDYLVLFHLALQEAHLRQLPDAVKHVQQSLKLKSDFVHSLHLLALLLSAQKRDEEALALIEAALAEYPDQFSLLLTKSKLEEVCYGVEQALATCKQMLQLWKDLFESGPEGISERRGTGLIDKLTSDRRSLAHIQLSELSDRDSGSVRESIAASRIEQALSEVASSMNSSYLPKQGPQSSWALQAQIWVHLAEFYLDLDKPVEANACVQESASILPLSHQVAYMKGRIHEHRMEYKHAKSCYESAVAINPAHIKSLTHLGRILMELGNGRMAEKILRDAASVDPTSHQAWQELGKVLESLGEYDSSADCLLTAVSLESASPVVPFSVIPRTIVQ